MAQVKFYGMTLDFQFVRDYFKTPEFKKFILQPYMEDAEKWRDEYFLLIYAIDEKGIPMKKKDLAIVENDTYQALNRLELGNISFNRAQLQPFIDEDNASGNKFTALYFSPRQYGEYVSYKVVAITESFRNPSIIEEDLKPSPPAPPAPGDIY
ncbi:MAG: hypothetical protein IPP02_01255 [Chitinophagaceae bacterium]|jgi:hypothetical protein|nr:hypothetical protein [Chitinophagaceae bacterium]MBK9463429.1 hypothetical protein [Chitinophagaceae bacterium]MBK9659448.1 hypothetical protein [Chitinophagaceae bacterium]MBK9937023.1 hypothetical protein [Chitinophagaceae bacterium]MBL0068419.1 hypothetical protein [Chitinophagaceae bacterium]